MDTKQPEKTAQIAALSKPNLDATSYSTIPSKKYTSYKYPY